MPPGPPPPPSGTSPAPPGRPPLPGTPPPYAPYAPPSRGALFLRRALTGDWAGSAKAAAWPAALLLGLALVISLPSPDAYERLGLGNWSDRFQTAVALLLQGLGATLEVEAGGGGGLLSLFIRGSGSLSVWPLTVTALWAGAVALGAKRLRRSRPAGHGGGAEAALRIALLCAAVVLVLGLVGRPDLEIVTVSTTPVLAALFSLALAGVVGGAVLCRDEAAGHLSAGAQAAVRAWGTALRALGLAVALCGLIVFFVIAFHPDEAGDWAWAGSLPVLANLGLMALGVSWGAGVEGSSTEHGRHNGGTLGLSEIGDLAGGWAQAGAVGVGVACAVILAVTAARRSAGRGEQVLSGVFFLAALWLLSFVSGGAMEMTTGSSSSSFSSRPRGTDASVATNVGELLLFGLLWTAGAVLLAGVLGQTRGTGFMTRTGLTAPAPAPAPVSPPLPSAPPVPSAQPAQQPSPQPAPAPQPSQSPPMPQFAPPPSVPSAPSAPSAPAQASAQGPAPAQAAAPAQAPAQAQAAPAPAQAPARTQAPAPAPVPASPFAPTTPPPAAPARSVSRPLVWVAIGLAAFLVGGAATAGVMIVRNSDKGDKGQDAKAPAAAHSPAPSGAPTGGRGDAAKDRPSGPGTGPSPSASAAKPRPPKGQPPKGYQLMTSPEGFSFAIPEYWQRRTGGGNQIDYSGPTGPGQFRIGIVPSEGKSAYDHFQEMEKQVGKQEGYQRLQMTANTFLGRPGALWEWSWKEKNGEVMHALNQAYVDANGTEYAIMFSERERFYPDARTIFDTALKFWWVGPYDVG
ncbi:hypothetical protein AB0F13_23020 [Streptomyces sp. NPDC026206]|uniref:hypothetical protein n=1 Tax=Streptomyces sp. NPDC026206 TaxID=3157089 RepID=UPI0033DFB91A